jgi:dCMP deaminase
MKQKFIDYFMGVAELTANLSYAKRLQVGAVMVNGNQIIATGYNGMPADWDNNCETREERMFENPDVAERLVENGWTVDIDKNCVAYKLTTRPEVLHAEMNCISKVARSTLSSEGATLFITHAPCLECAKAIYQAGVQTVYYKTPYRNTAGLDFLKQGNVNVHQFRDSV